MSKKRNRKEEGTTSMQKVQRTEPEQPTYLEQTEKNDNVIVFWSEPTILSVGAERMGESSRARILSGVNKISREVWNYLKNHPIQKLNIEDGSLKLLSEEGDTDWDEFEPAQAKKFIAGLSDIDELERVMNSQKPGIAKAAKNRYEEIMKRITPKQ